MINYLQGLIINSVQQNGTGTFLNNNVNTIANRTILTNNNNTEKYCEEISFNPQGQRYAIAIGYNPSLCNTSSFDLTNQLLCHFFCSQGYDRYYLLNIFSNVSTIKNFQNKQSMVGYFNKIFNNFSYDIYIFWGRSVYVNTTLLNSFTKINNNIYVIGNGVHDHQHPGRNTSVATIKSVQRNTITLNAKHHLV